MPSSFPRPELLVSRLRARHRAACDSSAGDHLRALRLARAERLLNTTNLGVGAIARAVGYAHLETFSAAFAFRYCEPPSLYRSEFNRFA